MLTRGVNIIREKVEGHLEDIVTDTGGDAMGTEAAVHKAKDRGLHTSGGCITEDRGGEWCV